MSPTMHNVINVMLDNLSRNRLHTLAQTNTAMRRNVNKYANALGIFNPSIYAIRTLMNGDVKTVSYNSGQTDTLRFTKKNGAHCVFKCKSKNTNGWIPLNAANGLNAGVRQLVYEPQLRTRADRRLVSDGVGFNDPLKYFHGTTESIVTHLVGIRNVMRVVRPLEDHRGREYKGKGHTIYTILSLANWPHDGDATVSVQQGRQDVTITYDKDVTIKKSEVLNFTVSMRGLIGWHYRVVLCFDERGDKPQVIHASFYGIDKIPINKIDLDVPIQLANTVQAINEVQHVPRLMTALFKGFDKLFNGIRSPT